MEIGTPSRFKYLQLQVIRSRASSSVAVQPGKEEIHPVIGEEGGGEPEKSENHQSVDDQVELVETERYSLGIPLS